ncbi:hypothetical protein LIS04_18 [Listeria phage LIS04]|nr:hypothetical protein LIS04_18 [Listeria phage LIS04]
MTYLEIDKLMAKLKKFHDIVQDSGASESEKDSALEFIRKFKEKYDLEFDPLKSEEVKQFSHKCKDRYEKSLLIRLLTRDNLSAYTLKGKHKNRIYFKTTQSNKDLILRELDFHFRIVTETFDVMIGVYKLEHLPLQTAKTENTCDDCKFYRSGKCFNSLSPYHLADTEPEDQCDYYKFDSKLNENEAYALRAGLEAFSGRDLSVRKGIE